MHPLNFRESWEELKCEHWYKAWIKGMIEAGVLNGCSILNHFIKKKKKSLYTLRALTLFQGDTKCMFPWGMLKSASHILCLWEASYCTVECPRLLHIPAASRAWQRAVFPWEPVVLCCLGQCCSKETFLTHALWAVLTPASEVEVSTGFVGFSP